MAGWQSGYAAACKAVYTGSIPIPASITSPGSLMSKTTVYHNPNCGTSRNVLALIRERGEEPEVIEYLTTPPSRERIKQLVTAMGVRVRDVLRQKGTPYDELGLDNPDLTDEQLLDAIEAHPILLNRPIVVTPKGTRLCRPSETVRELLSASLRRPPPSGRARTGCRPASRQ